MLQCRQLFSEFPKLNQKNQSQRVVSTWAWLFPLLILTLAPVDHASAGLFGNKGDKKKLSTPAQNPSTGGLFAKRREKKKAEAVAQQAAESSQPHNPSSHRRPLTVPVAPRPDRDIPLAVNTYPPAAIWPYGYPNSNALPNALPNGLPNRDSLTLPGYPRGDRETSPRNSVILPPSAPPAISSPSSPPEKKGGGKTRVFVLGDSQSLFPFAEELQRSLVSAGYEVAYEAVKNGTPYFWQGKWPSPILTRIYQPASSLEECGRWQDTSQVPRSISDYVSSYNPEVFIFQAGTNFEEDLAGSYPQGVVKLIQNSLDQAMAGGARVLWIGPPDARDDVRSPEAQDRSVATLRSALAKVSSAQNGLCFLDSRPLCPMPNDASGDGEHSSFSAGRQWGIEAGAWAVDAISQWRKSGLLQSTPSTTPPQKSGGALQLFTAKLKEKKASNKHALTLQLELMAKSDPGDVSTISYTDAFSIYRYRVLGPANQLTRLEELGVARPKDGQGPIIQVLHWTTHNDGFGPRMTRIGNSRIGDTSKMTLIPIDSHPLGEALGTMPRFDDFNDFLAPIFVARDLLSERVF